MDNLMTEAGISTKKNDESIFRSNILYLIALLGLLFTQVIVSLTINLETVNTSLLFIILAAATAFVVGFPTILFAFKSEEPLKYIFRVTKVDTQVLWLVIGLAVLGYPMFASLNMLWHWGLSIIGPPAVPVFPMIDSFTEFIAAVISLAIFPAVFEELMFRGVILRSYEKLGFRKAVVYTGVMFGLLHLSLANVIVLVLLGVVIGFVVIKSNSLFMGIIYHFVHNLIAVLLLFLVGIVDNYEGNAYFNETAVLDNQIMLVARIVSILFGVAAATGFFLCLIKFNKKTDSLIVSENEHTVEKNTFYVQMIPAFAGGLIIFAIFVIELLQMASIT